MRMIGYSRVSTEEQAAFGYGLAAQRTELERAAEYHGWELVELVTDEGYSAGTLERPGLQHALRRIAAGDADGLVVAKLDRLSRSVVDFGELLDWFKDARATLAALDLHIDTSTPGGRMVANVMIVVAQWERETIAKRTKDGLAAKRAKGEPTGSPAVADNPRLAARIAELRLQGLSLNAMCRALTEEGWPTPRGGKQWRPSSLQTSTGYSRPTARRKRVGLPPLPPRRGRRAAA